MAASDYEIKTQGGFCPMGVLSSPVEVGDDTITIGGFKPVGENDLIVGMAVLINDEIFNLRSVTLPTLSVYRGCADTVRALQHAAGSLVWFFADAALSDEREYLATETATAKVLPFTAASGAMPIEFAPPLPVTFNWRAFRPYPPARVRINGAERTVDGAELAPADTEFAITWAHRDRLLQGDQLIADDEPSIGPEVGTTYTARVFDPAGVAVRAVTGITGTAWSYTRTMFQADRGRRIEISSVRDGFESLQSQVIKLKAGGLGEALGENLGG